MKKNAAGWVSAIQNAAWHVRNVRPVSRVRHAQAIQRLGVTVRAALAESDDFEAILAAVVDGLRPLDARRLGQ